MKKVRHIIGLVLLILGMLLCLGAIGRLDFLAENASIGAADVRGAIIKSVIGVVFIGAAMCLKHERYQNSYSQRQ